MNSTTLHLTVLALCMLCVSGCNNKPIRVLQCHVHKTHDSVRGGSYNSTWLLTISDVLEEKRIAQTFLTVSWADIPDEKYAIGLNSDLLAFTNSRHLDGCRYSLEIDELPAHPDIVRPSIHSAYIHPYHDKSAGRIKKIAFFCTITITIDTDDILIPFDITIETGGRSNISPTKYESLGRLDFTWTRDDLGSKNSVDIE